MRGCFSKQLLVLRQKLSFGNAFQVSMDSVRSGTGAGDIPWLSIGLSAHPGRGFGRFVLAYVRSFH